MAPMDAVDLMQDAEARLADSAIRRQRAALPADPPPGGIRGLCSSCGGRIAPARLRALPATDLCIDCQRELEEGR